MGSGASFDTGIGLENEQYFCHACHRVFPLGGANTADLSCPHCASTFLEEVRGIRQHDIIPVNRNRNANPNPFGSDGTILTTEQSRRMNSAAAMLRLLEAQLREELEHMNFAFQNPQTTVENRNPTKAKFSKIMAGKLRSCTLDVDIVCSQPSCPICSEDFQVGSEEHKLPCGHFFHKTCVVPWLEMKQNCPICRTCLTDEIPSIPDLVKLSVKDLTGWLELMQSEDSAGPKSVTVAHVAESTDATESPVMPKLTQAEAKDSCGDGGAGAEDKEGKDDPELSARTAMATKLQKQLQDYERATLSVAREEERRQLEAHNAFAHLQRARLHHLDEQITDYLSWRSREEAIPTRPMMSNIQMSQPRQRIATSGTENSSNSIAAALRRGLFPATGNSTSTASLTSTTHHNHNTNTTFTMSSNSLTGSTRLSNGTDVVHRIRIVDDDSDDESNAISDEENNEALQALYQRANADHLSRFNFQTLGGMGTSASANMGNMNAFGARSFTERSSLIGAGARRREAESNNMMEIFNRALYPELSDPDTEDWGEQLSQIDGSSRRRRAFNSITASASARETAQAQGSPTARSRGTTSSSFSAVEAIERSADQHHHARVAASAFAPTTDALDDHIQNTMSVTALAAANLSATRPAPETTVATGASPSSSDRINRIGARVSAIDRYMTLSAPQLFGTGSTTTTATVTNPSATIGTTYQVRASGNGSYDTVAMNASSGSAES